MKKLVFTLLLAAGVVAVQGCVERELFIKSDPPGAEACIDGCDAGETPVTVPFTYYGDRLLELRLKGYSVERTSLHVDTPWYQIFPLDFVTDLLWPGTITDTHSYSFELEPLGVEGLTDKTELMERAEKLRYDPFVRRE